MSVILASGRLRQRNTEFKACLGYTVNERNKQTPQKQKVLTKVCSGSSLSQF